jgi:hypothetical protein
MSHMHNKWIQGYKWLLQSLYVSKSHMEYTTTESYRPVVFKDSINHYDDKNICSLMDYDMTSWQLLSIKNVQG